MIVDTQQLAALLGAKKNCIKVWKCKGILDDKLKENGYTLEKEYREGHKLYYELNDTTPINEESLFNKQVFNVEHPYFKHYYIERTQTAKGVKDTNINDIVFQKDLANITGCSRNTIKRWDNILQDLEILSVDGYLYIRIMKDKLYISNRDEYIHYCKQVNIAKNKHTTIMFAYRRDEIDKDTMESAHQEYKDTLLQFADNYVRKISIYKLNKNNPLHIKAIKVYTEKKETTE